MSESKSVHFAPTPEYALSHLLRAAVAMAPTMKEQEAFGEMYTEMLMDNVRAKSAALQMLSAMQDGLRYGNWPMSEEDV